MVSNIVNLAQRDLTFPQEGLDAGRIARVNMPSSGRTRGKLLADRKCYLPNSPAVLSSIATPTGATIRALNLSICRTPRVVSSESWILTFLRRKENF